LLPEPELRGGAFRAVSYQWTEIIQRFNAHQIDMGAWGVWGNRGTVAELLTWVGLEGRAPRKQDFRYNFAVSGAGCHNLLDGMSRQAQRLVYLMDGDAEAWQNGIVLIRIGINDLGKEVVLDRFANGGLTPDARQLAIDCANYVERAVTEIRRRHATTRIVLVGVLNNSDLIPWLEKWRSRRELDNISAVLDVYDERLREVSRNDGNVLFWDDRAWFKNVWGARDEQGRPAYRSLSLGGPIAIEYTRGDDPRNAILADNHAGTVWNGLWARDLLAALNVRFGFHFDIVPASAIGRLADPSGTVGLVGSVQADAETIRRLF
jgi:hypothetical protein